MTRCDWCSFQISRTWGKGSCVCLGSGCISWGDGTEAGGGEQGARHPGKVTDSPADAGQGGLCDHRKPSGYMRFCVGRVWGVGAGPDRSCTTEGCSSQGLHTLSGVSSENTNALHRSVSLMGAPHCPACGRASPVFITEGGALALCDDANLEDLKIERCGCSEGEKAGKGSLCKETWYCFSFSFSSGEMKSLDM